MGWALLLLLAALISTAAGDIGNEKERLFDRAEALDDLIAEELSEVDELKEQSRRIFGHGGFLGTGIGAKGGLFGTGILASGGSGQAPAQGPSPLPGHRPPMMFFHCTHLWAFFLRSFQLVLMLLISSSVSLLQLFLSPSTPLPLSLWIPSQGLLSDTRLLVADSVPPPYLKDSSETGVDEGGSSEGNAGAYCSIKTTDTTYRYRWDVLRFAGTRFTFQVSANNDAHIGLSPVGRDVEDMYEIVLGGWGNAKSAIRRKRQGPDLVNVATPAINSPTEYRTFWINLAADGTISVGKGVSLHRLCRGGIPTRSASLMQGTLQAGGALGVGSSAQVFAGLRITCTNHLSLLVRILSVNSACSVKTTDTTYRYRWDVPRFAGTRFTFQVSANNDAHIGLSPLGRDVEDMYEIVLGGWGNGRSAIRRKRQGPDLVNVATPAINSPTEYRTFWINLAADGTISVGKGGVAAPFMSWRDPNPIRVSYAGYSTGWGSTGRWKFCSGGWLRGDPSWVVDSAGTPWQSGGKTYDAAKALDGDTTTYWNPQNLARHYNNWYIVLDLKAPYTLSQIAINNFGDTDHDIKAFKLQKSQTGSPYNWEDVTSVGNVQGGTSDRQEFGGFQGTARYWRFVVTQTHAGWQPWLKGLGFLGKIAGGWLRGDPSWVADSAGTPWTNGGKTYDAAKALDGDTTTYWNPQNLARHYNNWYIVLDLKAPHTLSQIAINNFGDTDHDIKAFKLQKSQSGSPYNWEDVKSVGNVQGGTSERQEFGGFQGTARYWRFVITQTHAGWQPWLKGLGFYGTRAASAAPSTGNVNLALNRPATQSTTAFKGDPGRAVDGNRNPIYGRKSCSHTAMERDPWWRVDLGSSQRVDRVVVYKRMRIGEMWLEGFQVYVGDNPNVVENPTCGGRQSVAGKKAITVNCGGMTGRYVGIALPDKRQYLILCEVEVYGGAQGKRMLSLEDKLESLREDLEKAVEMEALEDLEEEEAFEKDALEKKGLDEEALEEEGWEEEGLEEEVLEEIEALEDAIEMEK
ncbi:hypothetical protein Bbelb_285330 [Branchiostoma belcheri]|nr:hypothetical protein Bbelb_285330 [Branchiostoma belcheri]